MSISLAKVRLDKVLDELQSRYGMNILDIFTLIAAKEGGVGMFQKVIDGLEDPKKKLEGDFSDFKIFQGHITPVDIARFFRELGNSLDYKDDPKPSNGEVVRNVFPFYTQCENTTNAVLRTMFGSLTADAALSKIKSNVDMGKGWSCKSGSLNADGIASFPALSDDAVVVLRSAGEHILVLTYVGQRWTLYQSFQNSFLITHQNLGRVKTALTDIRQFFRDITGPNSAKWFLKNTVRKTFDYLIMQE